MIISVVSGDYGRSYRGLQQRLQRIIETVRMDHAYQRLRGIIAAVTRDYSRGFLG